MLKGRRHKMTENDNGPGFFCKRLPICPWKPQMKDRRSRCFCEVENSMGCAMLLGMPLFSTMNYDILMLSMTFLAVVISWIFMTDLGGFCWFHSLSYSMLQRSLPHSISVKSMAPSTLPWDFLTTKSAVTLWTIQWNSFDSVFCFWRQAFYLFDAFNLLGQTGRKRAPPPPRYLPVGSEP